jgi:predicted dienelactone hydrolase
MVGERLRTVVAFAAAALLVAGPAAGATSGVGVRAFRFVDHTRSVRYRSGVVEPRTLPTIVRYPLGGGGPFPLVVFAHGFALAPAVYAPLLDALTSAGYVVAAPVFPLERPSAPGGPSESDLNNEPADIHFVITRLLAGPMRGLIDAKRIAVAGQSDGGVAALAAAFATRLRDPRIRAAVVYSGAQPVNVPFDYGHGRLPLLAVQGSADTINSPANTKAFFALAHQPKFLLWLLGAEHLPPYTTDRRYLDVVERATVAFLDHYLRGAPLRPLLAAAAPGVAQLTAEP